MPLSYMGSGLIPAPLVSVSKTNIRNDAGDILHPEYVFTLQGTIVNVDTVLDSPGSQGFTGMEGVVNEQKRISQIFSQDGGLLLITPPVYTGDRNIAAYCRVDSVTFPQDVWVNRCNYNIVLRATAISGVEDPSSDIDSSSENWSITENEDGTYGLTHSLQAVGAVVWTSGGMNTPIDAARDWCRTRRYGIDIYGNLGVTSGNNIDFSKSLTDINTYSMNLASLPLDVFNVLTLAQFNALPITTTSGNFYNYFCSEVQGLGNRSWGLTENFIFVPEASGYTRETWSATLNYDQNNVRRGNISIQGVIYGLADRLSNTSLRESRAKDYFATSVSPNMYLRLSDYVPSGYTVSPTPLTRQVAYERPAGNVSYNYQYVFASGSMISGSLEESLDIVDGGRGNVIASIGVPGRAKGPILQNMQTFTSPTRVINISATMPTNTTPMTTANLRSLYLQKPNTNAIIAALVPESGYFYITQDTENYSISKGQYSRSVGYTLDPRGTVMPSGIPVATYSGA